MSAFAKFSEEFNEEDEAFKPISRRRSLSIVGRSSIGSFSKGEMAQIRQLSVDSSDSDVAFQDFEPYQRKEEDEENIIRKRRRVDDATPLMTTKTEKETENFDQQAFFFRQSSPPRLIPFWKEAPLQNDEYWIQNAAQKNLDCKIAQQQPQFFSFSAVRAPFVDEERSEEEEEGDDEGEEGDGEQTPTIPTLPPLSTWTWRNSNDSSDSRYFSTPQPL